jgi:endonuclease YncB( thermonuclease family)
VIRRRSRRYNVGVILAALAAALVIAIVAALREDETPGDSQPATATAMSPATVSAAAPASPSPTPAGAASATASPLAVTPPPPAPSAAPTSRPAFTHPNPASLQRASVLDVVDGDTIDVVTGGAQERVRLYGVDTPERGEPCFFEAAARTEALTRGGALLEPGPRQRDRYGRLLAYVYTPDGVSVDAQLIAEGLGTAWREDGQHRDAFVALEATARQAEVGCLWGR